MKATAKQRNTATWPGAEQARADHRAQRDVVAPTGEASPSRDEGR